jgi:hypothetical protein
MITNHELRRTVVLHNLYRSPTIISANKSRPMKWAGHEARMGEKINSSKIVVRLFKGKRPFDRIRCG